MFNNQTNLIYGTCLSQDNTIYATASLDTHLNIYLWNSSILQYSLNQVIVADSIGAMSCDITSNNSLIATAGIDSTIKIWKLNSPSNIYSLQQTLSQQHTSGVYFAKFNSDASMIISSGYDNVTIVWKWNNTQLQFVYNQKLISHTDRLYQCDISADNTFIISGGNDQTTKIWKLTNGSYFLKQTLNFNSPVYNIKFSNNFNKIINGLIYQLSIWLYNATSDSYYLSQTLTNHTGYVTFDTLLTGEYIYSSSTSDYFIYIWKLNQTTNNYNLNSSILTSSKTVQIVMNQYNSKIFHTGYDYKFYEYAVNLNCSADTNSNGANYLLNTCSCLQNYYWDFIQFICKRNCSLDINSNGTQYNVSVCFCNTNYIWSNTVNYCQYNCLLDSNSNGLNTNATACQCNINYIWSNTLNYCQYNCSKDPNSNNGINSNANICQCISDYYWSSQFNACTYNCSLDINSNGINLNTTSCQCNLNYYWGLNIFDTTLHYCHYDSQNFRILYNIILFIVSTPTISILFQFLQPILKFTDDFYYYIYHKRNYDSNLIYFMSMMFNITQNKWIPSYIDQYVTLYQNAIDVYAYSLNDIFNKTPTHFSRLSEDIFFVKNTLNYFTCTIPLSFIVFIILKLIYKAKKYKFISKILYAYSSYCFLLTVLIGDNIQYLSFRCFSQIYYLVPTTPFGYLNLIFCYLSFFIIILYSIGGFFLFKSFFQNKYNELLEVLHPNIKSSIFMSIQLGLNILSGYTHAALYYSPYIQMSILTSIQLGQVLLLICFGNQLKSKIFKVLLINQYLLRLILHIFFLIQLRLIEIDGLDKLLEQVLGNAEIMLIVIIICLNILQVLVLMFQMKQKSNQNKKILKNKMNKELEGSKIRSHSPIKKLIGTKNMSKKKNKL